VPCKGCEELWRKTKDFKYTRPNCVFSGLYAVNPSNHQPYRIYFCSTCGWLSAAAVHFNRCRYKDVLVETDTDQGDIHYTSCLEPDFVCDRCRRDLPLREWFCADLDASPVVRFLDVMNTGYFAKMGRKLMDEQEINDPQKVRDWIEKKKGIRNR